MGSRDETGSHAPAASRPRHGARVAQPGARARRERGAADWGRVCFNPSVRCTIRPIGGGCGCAGGERGARGAAAQVVCRPALAVHTPPARPAAGTPPAARMLRPAARTPGSNRVRAASLLTERVCTSVPVSRRRERRGAMERLIFMSSETRSDHPQKRLPGHPYTYPPSESP